MTLRGQGASWEGGGQVTQMTLDTSFICPLQGFIPSDCMCVHGRVRTHVCACTHTHTHTHTHTVPGPSDSGVGPWGGWLVYLEAP